MGFNRKLRRLRVRLKPGGAAHLGLHDSLQGQLAIEESRFLYEAAAGRRVIVEIGSYRGKSCAMLALGSASDDAMRAGHVTAIDPHLSSAGAGTTNYNAEDERVFNETMQRLGVAERVTHIVKTSHDARAGWPDTPIDLLWIDGDHSYEGCSTDLADWSGLVKPGGVLACHDYGHREGVRRAWAEHIGAHPERWEPARSVRSIAWTIRKPA